MSHDLSRSEYDDPPDIWPIAGAMQEESASSQPDGVGI